MRRIAAGDVQLHVVEKGTGQPLLLVHGFPLDHSMWRWQLDDLSKDFRVIAPDLRGFGQSQVTPGTVTMEQQADDLARLLDALDVRHPITFCGLSMGGYIAWQFWLRHRARLGKLILCDTRAIADPEEVARARLQMAERVLSQGAAVVADGMLPRLFAPATQAQQPQLVDALRQVMLRTDPQGIAASLRGMAQRLDFSERLAEISTPTLVLCGEHDEISRTAEMRGFAAQMPHAQFVEISHAGHMAPLENGPDTNAAIRRFLHS